MVKPQYCSNKAFRRGEWHSPRYGSRIRLEAQYRTRLSYGASATRPYGSRIRLEAQCRTRLSYGASATRPYEKPYWNSIVV